MSIRIKNLTLSNFRGFDSFDISFKKPWTVIVAPNAYGKSSVIEALYMLSHGDSPWESNNSNIIRISKKPSDDEAAHTKLRRKTGRIAGTVETDDDLTTIALVLNSNGNSTTKQFQIEGESTSRKHFQRNFHGILFSPDLIDLLMFEPAQRRNFIDTHASHLFADYYDVLANYQKVLRQRNSLLKILSGRRYTKTGYDSSGKNGKMLEYWNKQLLELGSELMSMRISLINMINTISKPFPTTITYKPRVPLHELGDLAEKDYIYETFEDSLKSSREKELRVGTTLYGPHRDDWYLTEKSRNLNTYGSRGEKRMAIADIILKLNMLIGDEFESAPVLLLDDIFSELDESNIDLLLKRKLSPDQQTIITTTSLEVIPPKVRETSHIITL